MRNCIILGSGRSGTSMTGGILSGSGYFMGDNLNPANDTNPKGQFEDREINNINEELLAPVTLKRPSGVWGEIFFRKRPIFGQRWLARVGIDVELPLPSATLQERMENMVKRHPYCFKDPRFSYTLSLWRPILMDVVYVCVFRDPAVTVSSILKQARTVPHLRNFSINERDAFSVWELMYSHILHKHYKHHKHYPEDGEWLFLHYDQFLGGNACDRLEETLGVRVDREFAEGALNRSRGERSIPGSARKIYQELCHLANYNP